MRKIDLNAEARFENKKAAGSDIRSAQNKFYWAVKINELEHIEITLRKIEHQKILEIGCSVGRDAEFYCQHAEEYHGIDLSDVAIAIAKSKRLPNARFYCTDAHELDFVDNSFDFVIVNSLLHHLDLEVVLPEIHRILKNTGCIILREPLGINPAFSGYRSLTPSARTEDEKPFDFRDLKLINEYFDLSNLSYFGFTNLTSAYLKSAILRKLTTKFDKLLARTPLRYLFWQISGILPVKK